MTADIAGQIVEVDRLGREKQCRVIQIMKGDLGGTLPKSLVAMVSTQTMPVALKHINSILKRIPEHRKESQLIAEAEGKLMAKGASGFGGSSSSGGHNEGVGSSIGSSGETSSSSSLRSQMADGNVQDKKDSEDFKQKYMVGGMDMTAVVNALGGSRKVLHAAQPFLIAALVVAVIWGRRRA
jgi:hypothetical protein